MYALRKDVNNKLNFINLLKMSDKQIEVLKQDPNVLFVDESVLPVISDTSRELSHIYYKLDANNTIVIDWERTNLKWIENKKQQLKTLVDTLYPPTERENNMAKKLYYEVYLKGLYPTLNIEAIIMQLVLKYYETAKQTGIYPDIHNFLINNLTFKQEDYYAYYNLLKIGIKVYWVRLCENTLENALQNLVEPVYPDYPINK